MNKTGRYLTKEVSWKLPRLRIKVVAEPPDHPDLIYEYWASPPSLPGTPRGRREEDEGRIHQPPGAAVHLRRHSCGTAESCHAQDDLRESLAVSTLGPPVVLRLPMPGTSDRGESGLGTRIMDADHGTP